MKVVSNMNEVIQLISARFESIDTKEITSLMASTAMAEMKKRIHTEGKDSNESQIGNYSPAYIKVRTGLYNDAKKAKKGVKSAGIASKGKSKGSERKKYQRNSDPKVILSLTREMEKNMMVVPLDKGHGIGWTNEDNFKKSQYNEKTYNKKIFNLTKKEREIVHGKAQDYINETFK